MTTRLIPFLLGVAVTAIAFHIAGGDIGVDVEDDTDPTCADITHHSYNTPGCDICWPGA